ncbi:MAG: hypothetical protein ABIL14_01460 [candidate division WOR-3 bacterium]
MSLIAAITGIMSGVVNPVIDVLKSAGVIKDPETEAKIKISLMEASMKAQDQLIEFIKATEPESLYTPKWVNGLRASVRPGVAWLAFLVYSMTSFWMLHANLLSPELFYSQYGTLVGMALAFYFGGRPYEKNK